MKTFNYENIQNGIILLNYIIDFDPLQNVCVCLCIYIYVCIYVCMCVCVYIYIYIYIYISMFKQLQKHSKCLLELHYRFDTLQNVYQ